MRNVYKLFTKFRIFEILRLFYLRHRLPKLYLAKLLGILVRTALQLRTLIGPFNFLDSSVTDESFVEETRVWRIYKI